VVVVEQLRVAQAEQLALRPPLQAGQDEQGYDDQGGAAAAEGEAQETLVGKIPYGLLKMGPELVNSDACPRPATGAEIQAPWEGLGGRIKALRRTMADVEADMKVNVADMVVVQAQLEAGVEGVEYAMADVMAGQAKCEAGQVN
jgi:hypothetical protein